MRTVFVLFDSLNARATEPYGCTTVSTPHLTRLARRAVTFDRHFVGSLPCMPARRDLHTGRLNFMHRSWGPLEPFDNSFPKLMSAAGIYTHLVSDHLHYFEEGGNGYAQAFDTWEFIRGQENDPWIAMVQPPLQRLREQYESAHYDFPAEGPATRGSMSRWSWKKLCHAVNRETIRSEEDYPTVRCFNSALDFIERNRHADDWFLQLEAFDPHEPFMAPERFKALYPTDWSGGILDWPRYEQATDSAGELAEIRSNYAALVSMCDDQLGRLLDCFDRYDLWKDTCLILTTDHGFLLAEHDWWGKNRMPYYTEISRIPLFIWHPDCPGQGGTRCNGLTQTPDLMPTFLALHDVPVPAESLSASLLPMLFDGPTEHVNAARPDVLEPLPGKHSAKGHDSVLFGQFGGPLALCNGRYLLFRFPRNVSAEGLNEYTLSPIHMSSAFTVDELQDLALAAPFDFTKGVRTLRVAARADAIRPAGLSEAFACSPHSLIFDLELDPEQTRPVDDPELERELLVQIVARLRAHDAPAELFDHYAIDNGRT